MRGFGLGGWCGVMGRCFGTSMGEVSKGSCEDGQLCSRVVCECEIETLNS